MGDNQEVAFVACLGDWEVLYYFKGGRFETAPIVAWGIVAQEGTFVRAFPVTTDLAWSIEDNRAICNMDGEVTCGDLERWDTVWAWLDEMQRRESDAPDMLPPERPLAQRATPFDGNAPVVLENFRQRFRQPQGDAS